MPHANLSALYLNVPVLKKSMSVRIQHLFIITQTKKSHLDVKLQFFWGGAGGLEARRVRNACNTKATNFACYDAELRTCTLV